VSVTTLTVSDVVLVRPGERIPTDGEVVEGDSAVKESMLTGESVPAQKSQEDTVIAGAVNGEGSLKIKVMHRGEDSYLNKVSEQPNQISTEAGYQFTVAPNPVTSYLTVGITTPESTALQLLLTDMNGRQYDLPIVPASTTSTQIDMTLYPAGMYLLRIGKADGPVLKAFKIIKIQ